jgi:sugar phosphate isomerase/epimerase
MKFAIQEDMLPGRSTLERFENARRAGLSGVELWAENLPERVLEIAAAMDATGLQIAAVNMGRADGYIAVSFDERQQAIKRLQSAMECACDLRAESVIFVPQYGESTLPDLTPFRTKAELEVEMYIWFLRTVNDLATAMGVVLCMQPVNRYESTFLNTISQAVHYCDEIKHHPGVRIAANLFHMALEEVDIPGVLRQHGELIDYVHLGDSNHRLPGRGLLNFASIAEALHDINFAGWLTFTGGTPGQNQPNAAGIYGALPVSLAALKAAGLA